MTGVQAVAGALPPVGPRASPGLPIPSPTPGDQLKRGSISRLNMQPLPGWNSKLCAMTQTEIPAVREVGVPCTPGVFLHTNLDPGWVKLKASQVTRCATVSLGSLHAEMQNVSALDPLTS